MVVLCPDCNTSQVIFDNEGQSHCCSDCGLVLNDEQIYKNNNGAPVLEDSESVNNALVSPLLEARYHPKFEHLQRTFAATDEETDFVRQLCLDYLSHPQRIFENSATEVVLCLFYLVVLQHHEDQSLLLSDYCQMVNADSKRCLTIYGAIRRIVSGKLAILPSDYDPQLQLDNVMRFLYPALLQSAPSSPTLQQSQRSQPLFYYHSTPVSTRSNKRISKGQQQQQRKRQKNSTTTVESTRPPLSSLTPETTAPVTTDIGRLQSDDHMRMGNSDVENQQCRPQQQFTMPSTPTTTIDNMEDDDFPANLGPGEPVLWPTQMDDVKIRQQTTRLMALIKHNGLAEGRYGRPLMSACLLITMLGWFHQNQRQQPMGTMAGTRRSRSVSMLPALVIRWDELAARNLINSTARSRYKEVLGRLYSLGKTLPWLRDNLAVERDALHYLDDILQMMDVLQTNNKNQQTDQGNTSILTTAPSFQQPTTSSTLSTPSCDTAPANISPCLPPSFERATLVRQKRLDELDTVDRWNHDQQPNNTTAIWDKGSGVTDSVRMVSRLVASQKYHREAILAMSDSELVNHAYRVSTLSSSTVSTLDLDRQLDDFDLSNEEMASYLV